MKDKYGKIVNAGSWLLCVNDTNHCGETIQVEANCGTLCVPNCDGISCELPLSDFADENNVLTDYIVIDDPHKKIGYVRAAEVWKDLDLTKLEQVRAVRPATDLTLEQVARLRMLGYDTLYPYDGTDNFVEEADIILAGCDNETSDPKRMFYYDGADFDYDELEAKLQQFIRPSKHYLVFAYGVRWDGANGYMFANSLRKAIFRNYETSIYPISATQNGKTLVCRECSHDVPTGARTVIIALTDTEYECLCRRGFNAIQDFAQKCADKADRATERHRNRKKK